LIAGQSTVKVSRLKSAEGLEWRNMRRLSDPVIVQIADIIPLASQGDADEV